MGRKRKSQDVLPRSLVSHGEDFMALFAHGDDQSKKQRVTPANKAPEVRNYSGLEPASASESEEEFSDVDEKSDELSEEESEKSEESEELSSDGSDSLDCLDALKKTLSSKSPKEIAAKTEATPLVELAEEDRDNFMSGKVGKVHRKTHRSKAWLEKKESEGKDDDEIARELFKQASKEVQMLGTKGMSKGATRDLKQKAWERLGGKPRKGHRIPKSVGVPMYRNRLAKEKANKLSEEKEGRVLRDSLKVLREQKTRKKKEHHKRQGGKMRNAVFQGP
ncbi:hypothetical protein BSKO_13973 [Bryopsis sp. KO-2023]|nr:hypothetical protein BSKO_13973 [Bryopsis sp. KO-2023]